MAETLSLKKKKDDPFPEWVGIILVIVAGILGSFVSSGFFTWVIYSFGIVILIMIPTMLYYSLKEHARPVTVGIDVLALPKLHEDLENLSIQRRSLRKSASFHPNDSHYQRAWEEKDTQTIAAMLESASQRTQSQWDEALKVYNATGRLIDEGRKSLQHQLNEAEKKLLIYGIPYQSIPIDKSKAMYGIASNVTIRKEFRLNITGGIASTIPRVMTGNVPPLLALGVIAAAVLWNAKEKSAALRRLKEAEGQLATQSAAVQSDVEMIELLFETRLFPQLNGILTIIGDIASSLEGIEAAEKAGQSEQDRRGRVTRLALMVAEGKYLIELTAGD